MLRILAALCNFEFFWSSNFCRERLAVEWDSHFKEHLYWRSQVFSDFGVQNIETLLNLEPSIDHEEYYGYTIPQYFQNEEAVDWIENHFSQLNKSQQLQARTMLDEGAAILGAHAMCHPRDRVGQFDHTDVLRVHETLQTKYHRAMVRNKVNPM